MPESSVSTGWGPAMPPRRVVIPIAVAFLGISITLIAWGRVVEGWRQQEIRALSALADESRSAIQNRVEQHMQALRDQAKFWQLHGLLSNEAWAFDAQRLLNHFTGLAWIAWIDRAGDDYRFMSGDSAWTPSATLLTEARDRIANPGKEFSSSDQSGHIYQIFLPVRTPAESLGVLAAALRADSLIAGGAFRSTPWLAYTVTTPGGRELFRYRSPASEAPEWLNVRVDIPLSSGDRWLIDYQPTQDYLASRTTWLTGLLWIGFVLSLTLGVLTYQFLRLRDYSTALALANRELEARVLELSRRDQELRETNEALEERVATRTRELEDALQDLEAFSRSVSHDLRSPIGAIQNFALMLEEDFASRLDEKGLHMLQRIRSCGRTATKLLDRLVEFASADRRGSGPIPVDMTSIVRGAFQEVVAGEPDGRDVVFVLRDLPPAHGDPELLQRVFANLLSNALKYTRGRDQRRIEVGAGPAEGDRNTYYVVDNGVGFDPGRGNELFKPFRRLHHETEYQGLGLGLAIAAKIVRKQGGRIWAESDGANGARFCLALPRNGTA